MCAPACKLEAHLSVPSPSLSRNPTLRVGTVRLRDAWRRPLRRLTEAVDSPAAELAPWSDVVGVVGVWCVCVCLRCYSAYYIRITQIRLMRPLDVCICLIRDGTRGCSGGNSIHCSLPS